MSSYVEIEIECPSCGGKGLYSGMALQRAGSAVVCHTCNGTGKSNYRYKPFTGRKVVSGIKRVFKSSFGYIHLSIDVYNSKNELIEFSKGGVPYSDWLNGEKPLPVKSLYCPYVWTDQMLQNKDVNDLYKNRCNVYGDSVFISNCKMWAEKAKCWEIFESRMQEG